MATENDQVHVVDVTQRPELAQKFSVMATPTTVLVRDGLVQQVIVGARTPAAMRALVAS